MITSLCCHDRKSLELILYSQKLRTHVIGMSHYAFEARRYEKLLLYLQADSLPGGQMPMR